MGEIVVGLDGSDSSRVAFGEAIREATWRGTSVLAMHVVHYPSSLGYGVGYLDFDVYRKAGAAFLESELGKLEAEHGDSFPVEVTSRVAMGHTGAELVLAARNEGGEPAELVVVGSRGLGGFKGLLLGSVTTYLVHHLDVPVLVIPTPGS